MSSYKSEALDGRWRDEQGRLRRGRPAKAPKPIRRGLPSNPFLELCGLNAHETFERDERVRVLRARAYASRFARRRVH